MTLRQRSYLGEGKASDKKRAIALVKNLLLARRARNIKREQAAYDKLRDWCDSNGYDMQEIIDGATGALKKSVGAIMNDLVAGGL